MLSSLELLDFLATTAVELSPVREHPKPPLSCARRQMGDPREFWRAAGFKLSLFLVPCTLALAQMFSPALTRLTQTPSVFHFSPGMHFPQELEGSRSQEKRLCPRGAPAFALRPGENKGAGHAAADAFIQHAALRV